MDTDSAKLTTFDATRLQLREYSQTEPLSDDERARLAAWRTANYEDALRRNVICGLTRAHRESLLDLSLMPCGINQTFDPRAGLVERRMGWTDWKLTTAGEHVVRLLKQDGETR